MGVEKVPEVVRDLVESHLISAVHLEVLLLLHRRPQRNFDASAVGKDLRVDVAQAGQILSLLSASGLARRYAGAYRYRPKSPELSRAVEALARMYPAYRVAIVSLIFSRPVGPIHDHPPARLGPGSSRDLRQL